MTVFTGNTIQRYPLTGIAIPEHPDLMVSTSRDTNWLSELTSDGQAAEFTISWTETVDIDGETSHETRSINGRFSMLRFIVESVTTDPARTPDSPVELDISEWALYYRR